MKEKKIEMKKEKEKELESTAFNSNFMLGTDQPLNQLH